MVSQFGKSLKIVDFINKSDIVPEKISSEELESHSENVRDLKTLLSKFSSLVDSMEKNEMNGRNAKMFIVQVHPILIDLKWHIDDLDELLINLLKRIPSKGNEIE